jgi:hypothetical protein
MVNIVLTELAICESGQELPRLGDPDVKKARSDMPGGP